MCCYQVSCVNPINCRRPAARSISKPSWGVPVYKKPGSYRCVGWNIEFTCLEHVTGIGFHVQHGRACIMARHVHHLVTILCTVVVSIHTYMCCTWCKQTRVIYSAVRWTGKSSRTLASAPVVFIIVPIVFSLLLIDDILLNVLHKFL